MEKRIATYIVFAFTALIIGGTLEPVKAKEHIVFTPQWRAQAQFAGYYVAKDMGFYEQEGLEVDIVHPLLTQSPVDCMQNGKCQVTTMNLFQAMETFERGIPVVNILQTSMNSSALIISRREMNPLEQKGARVGTWVNGDAILYCVCQHEHLDYEWIHFVSAMSLFIKGGIDAMTAVSYGEYFRLKQAGMDIPEEYIFRLSEHGYNIQEDGVYMTASYYRTHRKQADKFARASRKGWEWAVEHPEEALKIVLKYVHNDNVATNWIMQQLMLEETFRLQLDPDSGRREFRLRPDMVKQASDLMMEAQMLTHEVTYDKLIGK